MEDRGKNIIYDYKSFNFIEAWKRIWTNNPNFHRQFSNLLIIGSTLTL